MNNFIERESRFSRSLNNHAKLGAYYTDLEHCKAISNLLYFPEQEEILCLEPSVGDGKGIIAASGKAIGDHKHIYAVEINRETAVETAKDERIESVVNADFLIGVNATTNIFGFCFSNPPYMVQDGVRTEELFLDRITKFLKKSGVLVYIIPYSVFSERSFFRKLYNRYDVHYVYRFWEGEYTKWHQVVVVASKRGFNVNALKDEVDRAIQPYLEEEEIPLLPKTFDGQKICVPSSNPEMLTTFTTSEFPVDDCIKAMSCGLAKEAISTFQKSLSKHISAPVYLGNSLGRPPIHPNKDSMYLLGVCGAGSGLCGKEEDGNLHLQRGVVKMVEDLERTFDAEAEREQVVATTRAKVSYTVIQQDGKISEME